MYGINVPTSTIVPEHYMLPPNISAGAVCSVSWSSGSGAFAVSSTAAMVHVYVGAGCEYSVTAEIKEIQVCITISTYVYGPWSVRTYVHTCIVQHYIFTNVHCTPTLSS